MLHNTTALCSICIAEKFEGSLNAVVVPVTLEISSVAARRTAHFGNKLRGRGGLTYQILEVSAPRELDVSVTL